MRPRFFNGVNTMIKAKIILSIYNLLPDQLKTNQAIAPFLQRLAEKEIVNLQKKIIENHWKAYELKSKLR